MPHRWPAGWSPSHSWRRRSPSRLCRRGHQVAASVEWTFLKPLVCFSRAHPPPCRARVLSCEETIPGVAEVTLAALRYRRITAAGRLLVVAPRQLGFGQTARPLRRHRGGTVGQQHRPVSALARDGDHTPEIWPWRQWNRLVIGSLSPLATRNKTSRCHFLFPSSTRRRRSRARGDRGA